MALSFLGAAVPVPVADPNKRETFVKLGTQFKLDPKTIDFMLDTLGLESLQDFAEMIPATFPALIGRV